MISPPRRRRRMSIRTILGGRVVWGHQSLLVITALQPLPPSPPAQRLRAPGPRPLATRLRKCSACAHTRRTLLLALPTSNCVASAWQRFELPSRRWALWRRPMQRGCCDRAPCHHSRHSIARSSRSRWRPRQQHRVGVSAELCQRISSTLPTTRALLALTHLPAICSWDAHGPCASPRSAGAHWRHPGSVQPCALGRSGRRLGRSCGPLPGRSAAAARGGPPEVLRGSGSTRRPPCRRRHLCVPRRVGCRCCASGTRRAAAPTSRGRSSRAPLRRRELSSGCQRRGVGRLARPRHARTCL